MHNKKEADTESVLVSLYSLLQITRAYGDNNTSVFSLEIYLFIQNIPSFGFHLKCMSVSLDEH